MPEVNLIDWHVHPFRAERWYELWHPALARSLGFGARSYSLSRSEEDPLHFMQRTVWDDREDFERYWSSDEVARVREETLSFYNKPLLPTWHSLLVSEVAAGKLATGA